MSSRVEISSQAGFLWALASAVSFGLMSWLVHACPGVPPAEIALLRGLAGLAILTPLAWRRLSTLLGRRSGFLWLRALSGAVSILCYYWNLQHTSVGTSKALQDLAPIFVAVYSLYVLRERLGGRTGFGIALAIGGALVIGLQGASPPSLPVLAVGLLGAVAAASAFLSLREAAVEHSPELVVWTLCAASSVVSSFALFGPDGTAGVPSAWVAPRTLEWVMVLGVALTGLAGQLWMTRAYQRLSASVASALGLTALLWGVLFEIAFSHARPATADWIGYACILVGAIALRRGAVAATRGSPDEAT
jgi:drug/metabolite transporter (DMT)-like permease